MRRFDVLGLGTALVDYFARVDDDFLKKNRLTKGATNFLARDTLDKLHAQMSKSIFLRLPGDNARNVCEGVSHLGGRSAYASNIGRDPEGKFFSENLRSCGIKSLLVKSPGRTGKIIALITPDSQRTFMVDLGNSTSYDLVPEEAIELSEYLYITSITLLAAGKIGKTAERAMALAKEKGVKIAFSLESPPMIRENRARLLDAVKGVDILFANEEEFAALTPGGEGAAHKLAGKNRAIYLKMGGMGSTVFFRRRKIHIPCYSKKTVDTTGAGDFYAAGTIYGLCHGEDIWGAGHTGAKLAGKVVEHFGATVRNALSS